MLRCAVSLALCFRRTSGVGVVAGPAPPGSAVVLRAAAEAAGTRPCPALRVATVCCGTVCYSRPAARAHRYFAPRTATGFSVV
ncbi:hypothetical protein GCM10027091_07840 [Streptomyces daliensis]